MKKSKITKRLKRALRSTDSDGYWKWKILPSPMKLGMSDSSNSLGSKVFGSQPGQACWEDWDEKVKAMYPVRYYLIEELGPIIKQKYRQWITAPIYWLKCHLFTKYKYHLIDIRDPKGDPRGYRYGWIDSDHKMVLALFAILNDHVKDELENRYCPTEEEVQTDPYLLDQRNRYLEVQVLHYWWNIERKRQEEAYDKLQSAWSDAKSKNDPAEHQMWADLHKEQEAMEEQLEGMLARLLKVRHFMWT